VKLPSWFVKSSRDLNRNPGAKANEIWAALDSEGGWTGSDSVSICQCVRENIPLLAEEGNILPKPKLPNFKLSHYRWTGMLDTFAKFAEA